MPSTKNKPQHNIITRPPVVAVLGHIDHGKSTLLDYIRKSNIVAGEAGGITQQIAAYEITHMDEEGSPKRITFLDTPGHAAFSGMRERGVQAADIAILIVSAEDSVMPQTIEAWNTIKESKIPTIVAINKIDKPGANVEKTKNDLTEKGIYIEGYGGDIPFVEISAKEGLGVSHLLDIILLVAQLADLTGDQNAKAEGVIIESALDVKRGISASLLIKDGSLRKGMFVRTGEAISPTRILENFKGESIDEATFSSPIRITGFSKLPEVGAHFFTYASKREAEEAIERENIRKTLENTPAESHKNEAKIVPIILKTDTVGTAEAVEKEIMKLASPTILPKIIGRGVGDITENDQKTSSSDKESIILGFNVKVDRSVNEASDLNTTIKTFDIIYKLTDWLKEEIENRRPKISSEETTGKVKIIKSFNKSKERQVIGGKVTEGTVHSNSTVNIIRRENKVGTARIVELQQGKLKTGTVMEGNECGIQIESKIEVAPGDILEAFIETTV